MTAIGLARIFQSNPTPKRTILQMMSPAGPRGELMNDDKLRIFRHPAPAILPPYPVFCVSMHFILKHRDSECPRGALAAACANAPASANALQLPMLLQQRMILQLPMLLQLRMILQPLKILQPMIPLKSLEPTESSIYRTLNRGRHLLLLHVLQQARCAVPLDRLRG